MPFQIICLFLRATYADQSKVNSPFAWNSEPSNSEDGLSLEGHLLLKQGIKIGYLTPSDKNCK